MMLTAQKTDDAPTISLSKQMVKKKKEEEREKKRERRPST